jgi:hypothetical protein
MTSLSNVLRTLPLEQATRPGERVFRWGDELAVILLDSGRVGQIAAAGAWSRVDVEAALRREYRPPAFQSPLSESLFGRLPIEKPRGQAWQTVTSSMRTR